MLLKHSELKRKQPNHAITLLRAAQDNSGLLLRSLLDLGADVRSASDKGITALHIAAKQGNLESVELLLRKGADIDARDTDGNSVLHHAASSGHLPVVHRLAEESHCMTAANKKGHTALHLATMMGHTEIVSFLIENISHVPAQSNEGLVILGLAAESGSSTTLQLLLAKFPAQLSVEAISSLFREAILGRNLNTVRLLLERGANVNHAGNYGRRALHYAALTGQRDIGKFLLDNGADINARTWHEHTALSTAAAHGHKDIAELFLDNGAKVFEPRRPPWSENPLVAAASRGHTGLVRLLLCHQQGPRLEHYGFALIEAAKNGHSAIVSLLLEKAVDDSQLAEHCQRALSYALERGRESVVELLVAKGTDLDTSSALGEAAERGYIGCARLLIHLRGAEVNTTSDTWIEHRLHQAVATPLHRAAANGHKAMVSLLLENGADVTAMSDGGTTALQEAAMNDHEDIVLLLLETQHARQSQEHSEGALLAVLAQGFRKSTQLLLSHGVKLNSSHNFAGFGAGRKERQSHSG